MTTADYKPQGDRFKAYKVERSHHTHNNEH